MEVLRKAVTITHQNFLNWRRNDRVLTLFGITGLLIFVYMGRIPFYGIAHQTDNSLFLLPFLFNIGYNANGSIKVMLLFGIILLFSEAPFLSSHKIYLLIRSKRASWWIGEVLYILSASLVYMLFLLTITTVIALPRSTLSGWGKTILLGTFGSGETKMNIWRGIVPSPALVRNAIPYKACLFTFFSGWLVFSWLGLFIHCVNLHSGKDWPGVASAVLLVLADPVLRMFGENMDFLFFFSPASWCTLSTMKDYALRGYLTVPVVFLLLAAEILFMTALIGKKSHSIDIADFQEG